MPGENISHFNGIRIRVTGSGSLRLRFESLDNIRNYTMVPITMAAATDIQPTRLANLMTQRCLLRGEVTGFQENFVVSKIVIMFKPQVFSEYPA